MNWLWSNYHPLCYYQLLVDNAIIFYYNIFILDIWTIVYLQTIIWKHAVNKIIIIAEEYILLNLEHSLSSE